MRRLPVAIAGLATASLALVPAASAATKTVDLGVPKTAQKAFQPTGAAVNDFFPHGVTIHVGDAVKFVPLEFHNVDIPARGKQPAAFLVPGAAVSGSLDAAGSPFWFNGQPSFGINGAVIPGGFGKKLAYTGAKTVQSGLPLSARPKPMTVTFKKAGSFTYYCDIHPGMKGTVRVLAQSKRIPTAKQDAAALAKQLARALKIAKGLKSATVPDGVIDIGRAGAHGVEYFDFLPATRTVPVGTTIKFEMPAGSFEGHTATTGPGNPDKEPSSYLGTLAASFEAPVIDARAAYPSDPPPAGPAKLTPTLHGNGFWNSGALDADSASPQPASSSVTFNAPGTYQFYCLIHPFMHGTVVVQ